MNFAQKKMIDIKTNSSSAIIQQQLLRNAKAATESEC
jgi:hypothetical protein